MIDEGDCGAIDGIKIVKKELHNWGLLKKVSAP
jgi:hypothetical protein